MPFLYNDEFNTIAAFSTYKEGVEKFAEISGYRLKITKLPNGHYYCRTDISEKGYSFTKTFSALSENLLYEKIFLDIRNEDSNIQFIMTDSEMENLFNTRMEYARYVELGFIAEVAELRKEQRI